MNLKIEIMSNCVICSSEHTFMNASVGKLSDVGSVCSNNIFLHLN